MLSCRKYALVVLLFALSAPALAQVTAPDEYNKLIKSRSEVVAFGAEGFGDRIDLGSGSLEIVQTDVDLIGSNALPVRVTRRFKPADSYAAGHFRRWRLDLPSVHGVFPGFANGWQADAVGTAAGNRCTLFGKPPLVLYGYGWYDPDEYWHGTFLSLPGSGDQELLFPVRGRVPADGKSYYAVTKDGAAARCVPLSPASESLNSGEGFEVVAPDGVVYTLDHMVTTNQPSLRTEADWLPLTRKEYFLYPTKVADRFGNTVTYSWNPSKPWQLMRIEASDGRHLDFTYVSATSDWVASVTDGARTWRYEYSASSGSTTDPDTLTLPDGSTWSFSLGPLAYLSLSDPAANCGGYGAATSRSAWTDGTGATVGTITSPSGATLTLSMKSVRLGRSHVPYNCASNSPYASDDLRYHSPEPYLYPVAAVVARTITGSGLPAGGLTWNYAYGPSNNCWDGNAPEGVLCTSASSTTRQVKVTDPDGSVTRYTFGNRYNDDEGMLYKTEAGVSGTTALRVTDVTYADPVNMGFSPRALGDFEIAGRKRPQRKVVTTQQGRTFTWEVATGCGTGPYCFDAYARPTRVVESSTP